ANPLNNSEPVVPRSAVQEISHVCFPSDCFPFYVKRCQKRKASINHTPVAVSRHGAFLTKQQYKQESKILDTNSDQPKKLGNDHVILVRVEPTPTCLLDAV